MIGRVPRHRTLADTVEIEGTFVFIPGALASGFLVSLGLLVGDAIRRIRGERGAARRVELTARALVAEVRDGSGAAGRVGRGLRPPWVYGLVGGASIAIAAAVVPGATWNFLNPGGYLSDISWIWAISLLGSLAFAWLGIQSLRLAASWTPVVVGLVGLGFTVRFAVPAGGERALVAVVGAVATATATAATWRLRRRHRVIPASTRVLLSRTPLGSLDKAG